MGLAENNMQSDRSIAVSIIIVNWNTRDLLIECIQSILEKTADISCEIIVVDNASADDSVEAVRRAFPSVKLTASKANVGFAAGNNLGIAEARGEYVLLLNPDTIVRNDAIGQMQSFLQQHPEAGAVGCKIDNPDGTPQESYWMEFPSVKWLLVRSFYLDKALRRLARLRAVERRSPFRVAHLLGACIMTRMPILEELNGFDESYFLYMEETDLCYRISMAGKHIYHLPSVSIVHFGQQSSIQAAEWTNVELYLSTYKFLRSHSSGGALSRLAIQAVLLLTGLVRLGLWSVRVFIRPGDRSLSVRMLKGYWRLCWTIKSFEKLYRKGLSASGNNALNSENDS